MKPNLIAGEWVEANQARRNVNPSDLSDVIDEYGQGSAEDVARAIDAAHTALPAWSRSTPQVRADLLDAVGNEITAVRPRRQRRDCLVVGTCFARRDESDADRNISGGHRDERTNA
jgi:acyl-CoA reductase-like NAD-dependent aldehyde dehydrogenase